MISNISPSNINNSETYQTLLFSQNAKFIKNKAKINEISKSDRQLEEEIRKLKEKNSLLMGENLKLIKNYEDLNTKLKNSDQDYLKNSKSFTKGNNISSKTSMHENHLTIDLYQEELNEIEQNILSKEQYINDLLRDKDFFIEKINQLEIDLKLKSNEIYEEKLKFSKLDEDFKKDNKTIKEYVLKNSQLSIQIDNLGLQLNQKDKQIFNIKETQILLTEEFNSEIKKKDEIIQSIKNDFLSLEIQCGKKDQFINELKAEIKNKNFELQNLQQEISEKIQEKNKILNTIEEYKSEISNKDIEIQQIHENINTINSKGKKLIQEYQNSIDDHRNKTKDKEEELRRIKQDIINKCIIIDDIKKNFAELENKYYTNTQTIQNFQANEERLTTQINLNSEKMKACIDELIKVKAENEFLSENK